MYFLFCGVRRLAVKMNIFSQSKIFSQLKRMGPLGPTALESDGPYFEVMGQ